MIRSFSWMLSGDMASRAAVLVTTLIAARSLTPGEFGLYIVLYAIAFVVAAIWDLGVSVIVTREVGSSRISQREALRSGSRLRVLTSPVLVAAFSIGIMIVRGYPDLSARVVIPFFVASTVAGMSVLSLAALRGAHRFSRASTTQAIGKWVTAVLSVFATTAFAAHDRLVPLALAFAIGEISTLVISFVSVRRSASLEHQSLNIITLKDALPFAANSVMMMLYNRVDVVLVGAVTSAPVAGIYGAASRGQDGLTAIPAALGAVSLPMIARAAAEGGSGAARPLVQRFWIMGLAVAIPVTIASYFAAPIVVPLLLGSAYEGSVVPLQILVLFLPLAVVQAPILAGLAAIHEGRMTTLIVGVTLLSAVILMLALVPHFGATGAAAASLGRDLIATPLALLIASRYGLTGFSFGRQPVGMQP